MNNINNYKNQKTGIQTSKVMDSIKTIKDRPSFDKVISSYEVGNVLRLKSGKDMFIMGNDEKNLFLEGFENDNKIKLPKEHYNEVVETVKLSTSYDRAYKESHCKAHLGILPVAGDKVLFDDWGDRHTGKIINMLPEDSGRARFLVDLGKIKVEVLENDILKVNDIPRHHYYKFFHSFGKIYERGIKDVEVETDNKFGEEIKFKGMILGIGEDKKGIHLAIQTEDAEMKSAYLKDVVKMEGKDYRNLDYNYTVETMNGDEEIFDSYPQLVEYLEEDLQKDLSSIKKIYRAHYLDDNYLSARDEDVTNMIAKDHIGVTNIDMSYIDEHLVNELRSYSFVGYYDSKLNKLYQHKQDEEDLEVTEQLFKDNSFYTTYNGYNINYMLDPRGKEIILTHLDDEGTITYDPDDIEDNIKGANKDLIRGFIENDVRNMVDKNLLVDKLGYKLNLESDSQIDDLRNMFDGFEIKRK